MTNCGDASCVEIHDTPAEVMRRLVALKSIQAKQHAIEAEYRKELAALEIKYNGQVAEANTGLFAIVNGEREPTAEEIAAGTALQNKELGVNEKPYADDGSVSAENISGIPEFWAAVLQNHPSFEDSLNEKDVEILKAVKNIAVEPYAAEGQYSYKIVFTIGDNAAISNTTLTKTVINKAIEQGGNIKPVRSIGTEIQWKDGQNYLKDEDEDSILRLFRTVDAINYDELDIDSDTVEIDEEKIAAAHQAESALEEDFALTQIIKDNILPHAFDFYTGEAQAYDESANFDDDYDEEIDSDEEDEEDDE